MEGLIPWLIAFFGGYVLGSIPFGLIIAYTAGQGDLRKIGSGNIGATNVLRTGKLILAFITLLFDSGKGVLTVGLAWLYLGTPVYFAAGVGVLVGHIFPVWLKFQGGKGVAVSLGIFFVLDMLLGLLACSVWVLTVLAFHYSSLASLVTMVITTLLTLLLSKTHDIFLLCLLISCLVILRHRANIQRLLTGKESKIKLLSP